MCLTAYQLIEYICPSHLPASGFGGKASDWKRASRITAIRLSEALKFCPVALIRCYLQ